MKIRSKLAALLALTLGTSLCAGCLDNNTDLGGGGGNPPSSPSAIELETEANKVYKEKIAKWTEYVSYAQPEAVKKVTATEIDNYELDSSKAVSYNTENGLYTQIVTLTSKEDIGLVEDVLISRTLTYRVFNTESREPIYAGEGFVPEYGLDGTALDAEYNKGDEKTELLNIGFANGIFEVVKTSYELVEGEFVDEALSSNYEAVVSYNYYDKAGTALAENLEERAAIRNAAGYQLVDIGEFTYALFDGEIIKKFPLGEETNIPLYNNATTLNAGEISYSNYGYYVQGDYSYCVTEEQFESVQVSQDFSMLRVPSATFEVLNKNYDVVAKYETKGYAVMGYAILENGNIYVCEYDMLSQDALSYDIISGDVKLNVNHKVIDVATGKITTLDRNYVVQKVYNGATPEVNTFLNAVTMSEVAGNVTLKEGYLLAQIQKFDNGEVAQDTTTVVLNANLEIVAELPNIVENQFGYVGFLEKDVVLLKTRSVDNSLIHYTGNVKTGDLELYFHNVGNSAIKKFDGGFIYNKKVYNYEFKELYDLTEYETIKVNGNLVYVMSEGGYWHVGSVQSSNGSGYASTFELNSIGNANVYDYYVRDDGDVRDAYGNTVLSDNSYYETEYEDGTDSSRYVEYNVEVTLTVITISQEEGVYLVRERKEYSEYNRYGYSYYEEIPNSKDGNVYYKFYILK